MTKKDYEVLAKIIKETESSSNGWMHKPSFVIIIASYLQRNNPRFDLQRFVKACGISEPISLEEAQRPVRSWANVSNLEPDDLGETQLCNDRGHSWNFENKRRITKFQCPQCREYGLSPITFGDLFTIEEFKQLCKDSFLIDDDGFGKYSNGKLVSNVCVNPSDVTYNKVLQGWTHVVWYNK
jgi:hypothetical protein